MFMTFCLAYNVINHINLDLYCDCELSIALSALFVYKHTLFTNWMSVLLKCWFISHVGPRLVKPYSSSQQEMTAFCERSLPNSCLTSCKFNLTFRSKTFTIMNINNVLISIKRVAIGISESGQMIIGD